MSRVLRIAGVALLLLAVAGWSRLRWEADVLHTLPAGEPAVRGLQLHQRYFAAADELLLRVRTASEEETTAAARALALHLRQMTSLVATAWWRPPLEEDPGALAWLTGEAWLHAPPAQVEALRERLAPAAVAKTLVAARERLATSLTPEELARLSYDPLGLTQILAASAPLFDEGAGDAAGFQSADGRIRFVWVKARPSLKGYRECRAWLEALQQGIRHWQDSNGLSARLDIGYTGRPAFMAEIGGGMERDLSGPALGTLGLIAALFYAAHRRWRPVLWLLALLLLNFLLTLGLGAWLLGAINVVNLGFAALLLGLAADYAIVLLQEARAHPELPPAAIQQRARPSIYWSAATTAGAFLLLLFSGLPGLGELGLLVALGVVLAAGLMTSFYLAPLRGRWALPPQQGAAGGAMARWFACDLRWRRWAVILLAAGCAATLGALGMPPFERATNALRPKHSQAYAVWEEFKQLTTAGEEPLLLLVRAPSAQALYEAAQALRQQSQSLSRQRVIGRFHLPMELALDAPWRLVNAGNLVAVAARKQALLETARQAGFTANAMALTLRILEHWEQTAAGSLSPMPEAVRWLRERCYAAEGGQRVVLGMVEPLQGPARVVEQLRCPAAAPAEAEVYLTNWEWMGSRLAGRVLEELPWLLGAMSAVVLLSLWLAFRAWREVALSLAALGFSLLLLLAWMRLAGWQWNLMNLMTLPLLFGLGVDYSLHLLLGLRRHAGDWPATHAAVGKALWLAGGTTAAAFASLSFSSNAGVASLGQTTAAGVLACLITAGLFLPAWECRSRP